MTTAARTKPNRRKFLTVALAGGAALPVTAQAATCGVPFDRAAYDRYVAYMNAGDPRVVDVYADDIKFIMNMRGKAAVAAFYARQRPFVRESLEVLFFCSDAKGAAAEVRSEIRCLKDCDDPTVFGRALKAGEVMRTQGTLLYVLNAQGQIIEIKGPPPEVLKPWGMEAA